MYRVMILLLRISINLGDEKRDVTRTEYPSLLNTVDVISPPTDEDEDDDRVDELAVDNANGYMVFMQIPDNVSQNLTLPSFAEEIMIFPILFVEI